MFRQRSINSPRNDTFIVDTMFDNQCTRIRSNLMLCLNCFLPCFPSLFAKLPYLHPSHCFFLPLVLPLVVLASYNISNNNNDNNKNSSLLISLSVCLSASDQKTAKAKGGREVLWSLWIHNFSHSCHEHRNGAIARRHWFRSLSCHISSPRFSSI